MNAIVGDNGIITNAQNATILQGCSALSEFLNEIYLDEELDKLISYDNDGTEKTPLEKVMQLHPDWFYSNGSYNYVLTDYEHKDESGNIKVEFLMLRLINIAGMTKDSECKDIVKQLNAGKADINGDGVADEEAYQLLTDVYGVTNDLQVYYCSEGLQTAKGADYTDASFLDGTKVVYDSSSGVSKAIAETLGIESSSQTLSSLRSNQEMVVSDASGLTSLEFFYDMPNVKKLTLKNYTGSLKGIEKAYKLTYLYFYNDKSLQNIADYSNLAKCTKIRELYFYNPNDSEVEKLFIGMKDVDYINLETMGFFGYEWLPDPANVVKTNSNVSHSSLSSLEYMNYLSTNTKNAVKVLYLNNNSIKNLTGLEGYINTQRLMLQANYLNDISVLANLKELTGLNLMNNYPIKDITEGITDLSAIDSCIKLSHCSVWKCSAITSLKTFVRKNSAGVNPITILRADGGILSLDFEVDTIFWNDENKNNLTSISKLYIDSKYSLLFSQKKVMVLDTSVTDSDFKKLANNSYIEELLVTNNKNIYNDTFQTILPTLSKLRCLDVSGTNIESLDFINDFTDNQKKYFNGICTYNSRISNLKGLENCPNLITLNAWGDNFHLIDDSDPSVKEISTKVLNTVGYNYNNLNGARLFQSLGVGYDFCSWGFLPRTTEIYNEMAQLNDLKYFNCYTSSKLPVALDLSRNKVRRMLLACFKWNKYYYITRNNKKSYNRC